MSTEERIIALEQGLRGVQSEFLVHLSESNRQIASINKVMTAQELNGRDIDHNLTMLLGMATSQGKDISAIKGDLGIVKERVERVEVRLDSMDQRLGRVEVRLDSMDQRLSNVEQGIQQISQQIAALATKLG